MIGNAPAEDWLLSGALVDVARRISVRYPWWLGRSDRRRRLWRHSRCQGHGEARHARAGGPPTESTKPRLSSSARGRRKSDHGPHERTTVNAVGMRRGSVTATAIYRVATAEPSARRQPLRSVQRSRLSGSDGPVLASDAFDLQYQNPDFAVLMALRSVLATRWLLRS